jgi:tetratricopeptide (TPR) repeat protein
VVGEGARIQFSEAVLALMHSLAEEQPLALVVDDIHLADATSLAVLHLLLRRLEAVPVMVLLTSAVSVADEAPSARRFVDNAEALRLTLVGVGPLPAVHAAELLDALVAREAPPSPTVRKALLAGARGNPMVLELLVADWQRRGDASLALSLGAMTAGAAGPPQEALRRVVGDTLAVLDPEARAVVELGAILGQRLNDLSMYMLVDLPVARTMRAMTTLTSHRVLRDAGSHLEFSNEYMRGQCYVAMASPLRRRLHSLVADRLLAQDGADEPIPGLEVAWHLVRGDRLPEAVPYLLAGGRESIRRGAPHEADLALTTGLPALTGAPRRAAILLLAEALQELGRWGDSLQVLDTPCDPYDASEECCREVLRVLNRRWLGQLFGFNLHEHTEHLFAIASKDIDSETRVKALSTATILVSTSRDQNHITRLGELSRALLEEVQEPYFRIHLLHSYAWHEAYRSGAHAALDHLLVGVELIDSTGTASSIAARMILATGVTLCQVGRYQEAEPLMERAVRYASKLDNPGLIANASSGCALVTGRLGRPIEQVDWARRALQALHKDEWGITAISAGYDYGLGLALAGREQEAQASVDELGARFGKDRPDWVKQGWALCRADILGLAGNTRAALRAGRLGTEGPAHVLMHDCFAGQYARWIALCGIRDSRIEEALVRIDCMKMNLSRFDLKDQAEILAASLLLESERGNDRPVDRQELASRLSELPPSVTTVLRRLGMDGSVHGRAD